MSNEVKRITVVEARERLASEIINLVSDLKKLNVVVRNRIYFFDKNLLEHDDFNGKTILLVGNISVGTEKMESDDFCDFAACVEIRTAYVSEEELDKAIAEFKEEIVKFIDGAKERDNVEDYVVEISQKQTEEAARASQDFAQEMKKNRIKLIIGIGALIVLIGGVALLVSLIL